MERGYKLISEPLWKAVVNQKFVCVKNMLFDGNVVDVNYQDLCGDTALMCMADNFQWNVNTIKCLLNQNGIDINLRNVYGENAFTIAVQRHFKAAKLLLTHGDLQINTCGEYGDTALVHVVKHPNIELVKLLMARNDIDLNASDEMGHTALMHAVMRQNIKITKLILSRDDVNLNCKDKCGWTAIELAANHKHFTECKLLIARGARHCGVLEDWKTYLPEWNQFKTYKYYPTEFNEIMFQWFLLSNRLKICKDIRILMVKYIARAWRLT